MHFGPFLVLLCFAIDAAHALNQIVIKGNKFFDAVTKTQFFIKGVAYQPRGDVSSDKNAINDPLADPSACARDAALMKKLGLNVIRVYEVDPYKNHDLCMKSFADAGIYLLLDIATPRFSINRKTPEYGVHLYEAYTRTANAFMEYDNMLAFIAGNEVTNDKTNTQASAFVKAAVRDVKQYLKAQNKAIPVGYASNDDEDIREEIKDYFGCGEEDEQVDFFGVNMYEWCGDSTFQKSGYADRTKEFEDYHKPVFLSEYGCNLVTPRVFTEVQAIYGKEMTGVWSGGVVYEWSQENNNYGLVKIESDGTAEELDDYKTLQKALSKVSLPKGVTMDAAIKLLKPAPACPSQSENWKPSAMLPPTPSDEACACMRDNLSCMASDKVMSTDSTNKNGIGSQIDMLCGIVPCNEISADAEKGIYGAYSFCSPSEKLGWLYHSYMEKNKGGKCDFDGNAQVANPKRKDIDKCSMLKPSLASEKGGSDNLGNGNHGGKGSSSALPLGIMTASPYQLLLICAAGSIVSTLLL
ncbi:Glucanosyltransferase-domain-containing protein [Dichotomocladium elegans]|nr:Glucanosyltransferase-domain-containing protein [Dichotomocladium elegans]